MPFVSSLGIAALRDRLVHCSTLSKTYAMTGRRIGYAIAPTDVTTAIRHVHCTFNDSVNAAVQRAALTALTLGPELAAPMFRAYQERWDFVAERLAATGLLHGNGPDGAFYAFARYDADLPSTDMARHLLGEGVAVRAGGEFGPGGHRHIRLAFAAALDTLDEGITRITTALERLRT